MSLTSVDIRAWSLPPVLPLADAVRQVIFFRGTSARAAVLEHPRTFRVEAFPDGTVSLLFRRTAAGTGDLAVSGARTRALFKTTAVVPLAVSVQFEPGAASAFLGVPTSTLTDRIVRLEDLWGADANRLCDTLLALDSIDDIVDRILRELRERSARTPLGCSARLARKAVKLLSEKSESGPRIERLAASLGVSSRHLRRAFTEVVGVGPKEFVRMARLGRALNATTMESSWTRIAAEAGYYDQAHLIDEFRDLVGVTPRAFSRRDTAIDWGVRCPTR